MWSVVTTGRTPPLPPAAAASPDLDLETPNSVLVRGAGACSQLNTVRRKMHSNRLLHCRNLHIISGHNSWLQFSKTKYL